MIGTLKRHANFTSQHVASRHVDVWLPPGYDEDVATRFPVLYMHDGQNLFDPTMSFIGVDWGIHEAMGRLIAEGRVPGAIVVGIWNTPKRIEEYMPQRPFEGLKAKRARRQLECQGEIESDAYLKFITKELKPFVDGRYRTIPGQAKTFMAGSSMGGLISLYGVCEYPQVFGGAACLSTHWPIGKGVMTGYLEEALPEPGKHRIYFDLGTETLDAQYGAYQKEVDEVMKSAGYERGENWVTMVFEGAEHSERAWRKRVGIPLEFLLGGRKS